MDNGEEVYYSMTYSPHAHTDTHTQLPRVVDV